jgi:hypothetical protein
MLVASSGLAAGLFGGVMLIVWLVVAVLVIAGLWKTFVKAGEPGWGAIIPIYNTYLIIKIAGRPWWWLLLVLFIPIVDIIIMLIVSIDVAKNFGHGAGYGVLLWLFSPIMYLVLGFGSDEYRPVNACAEED